MLKCDVDGCGRPADTGAAQDAYLCADHVSEWTQDAGNVPSRVWAREKHAVTESFASLSERVTLEKRDGLWRMEATCDNGKRQIKTVAKELDWTLDMVRAFLEARGA